MTVETGIVRQKLMITTFKRSAILDKDCW